MQIMITPVLILGLFSAENQCRETYLVSLFLIWHWWPLAQNLGLQSPPTPLIMHIPLPELVVVEVGNE